MCAFSVKYLRRVVALPKSGDGREAVQMNAVLISFLVSVIAGVVANYIYKWLNRD